MVYSHIQDVLLGKFKEGETVNLRGWVYLTRDLGNLYFLVLRDATGLLQTVIRKSNTEPELLEKIKQISQETAVSLNGKIKKDERAPGGYEIEINNLNILGLSRDYPLSKKSHGVEFLLNHRHLWLRSPRQRDILKIRESVTWYAREFFRREGFTEVHPPMLTPSMVEGGATLFELKYFDRNAYLTQSSQLYLEALIFSLEKVWCLAPSFRAEKSRTRRHLTEYWHLEAEEAFYSNEDNMKLQEKLVSYICKKVAEKNREELETFQVRPERLLKIKPPFKRMKYQEAIDKLQRKGFDVKYGDDFGADEEEALTKDMETPLFITNYPLEIKAFYMKEDPNNPGTALCADLLLPEGYGEVIGGSERETNYEVLVKRIEETGQPIENYKWYLDLRKYGSVQHSGFGLGLERLIMWLLKLSHIREAVPFQRTPSRIYP